MIRNIIPIKKSPGSEPGQKYTTVPDLSALRGAHAHPAAHHFHIKNLFPCIYAGTGNGNCFNNGF